MRGEGGNPTLKNGHHKMIRKDTSKHLIKEIWRVVLPAKLAVRLAPTLLLTLVLALTCLPCCSLNTIHRPPIDTI